MTYEAPASIEDVVDVELLCGPRADPEGAPGLLVEVPHGADERRHYDALRGRLVGDLPEDLHVFFHVNTDVGAWAYGRATALRWLEVHPDRSALIVRSLIPRTFVDCNRVAEYRGGRLDEGALTPGIPDYVRHEADRALLMERHRSYVDVATQAFADVCGAGGVALIPHTYGPRTLGIDAIDDRIVEKLRWACEPERHDTWPLRAQIDLLTRDGDKKLFAPPGAEEKLLAAFAEAGFEAKANDTYYLHPSTLGYAWAAKYPGQVLSLEVRRDLLVKEWRPFEEMLAMPERCESIVKVLVTAL